ncbi:extracellular solute-binding protein [Enterococcus casseliflavus]|uniref:extracellular solute-binding protein n=1 Tax=Enterococcus casseliflavus TaxID=37734 RepID=UPI00379C9F61
MRVKKKLLGIAGVALCSMLGLGACGNSSDEGAGEKKEVAINHDSQFPIIKEGEELTLNIMAPGVGLAEWEDMPTLQDYQEKTGIKLTYTTPPSADFSTKLNLAFASGDLPDIVYGAGSQALTASMEIDYGSQGILLPLEEYITPEIMPNLYALTQEDPSILKSITTPDGHIYSLPMISRNATSIWWQGPMWYNGTWLDNLGVSELPKTTDELQELLTRFKNEDPNGNGQADEIPLTDVDMNSTRVWLMAAFGLRTRGIQVDDDVVSYTPTSENYKAFLEYMNTLYDEGLLDKEVYGQSDEQKKAKGENNQLGLFADYFSFFTTGRSEEEAMNDPMFQPVTSEWAPEAKIPGSPRISRGTFALTNVNPSPEASMRWVDYFYSEEGSKYIEQGPEGFLWEYQENADGEKVRVYADGIDTNNTEDERGKITPAYGLTTPNLVIDTTGEYHIRKTANEEPDTRFNDWVAKETAEKMEDIAEVPFPLLYLTIEENDKVAATATDLTTYVEQMEAKFITGVEPLDNWDDYVKTIEAMGIDEYVEVYQAAYDRWKAN